MLVLVLILGGQILVLVLVLGCQVLVLFPVLGGQVLVLVLVLGGQVLVNIPGAVLKIRVVRRPTLARLQTCIKRT